MQKTYKTTYEFHFQLAFFRRVVTSLRSSLASRRSGEHSLYLSGVLRLGDPDLYVIYCHFCTKYELICSINTFSTCFHPYLRTENVQNHVQISFSACILPVSRDVITEFPRTSPAGGAYIIYLSGVLRVGDLVLYIFTVFSVLNTN